MKKGIFLVIFAMIFVNPAYAAENGSNKSFFDSFIAPFFSIFSPKLESTISSKNTEIGSDRQALLKFLNSSEMKVRLALTGRDLYINRKEVGEVISNINIQVRESGVSEKIKRVVASEAESVEKALNPELTESPQIKAKETVLATFDNLEAFVFDISEEDARKLLKILTSTNYKF